MITKHHKCIPGKALVVPFEMRVCRVWKIKAVNFLASFPLVNMCWEKYAEPITIAPWFCLSKWLVTTNILLSGSLVLPLILLPNDTIIAPFASSNLLVSRVPMVGDQSQSNWSMVDIFTTHQWCWSLHWWSGTSTVDDSGLQARVIFSWVNVRIYIRIYLMAVLLMKWFSGSRCVCQSLRPSDMKV